MVGGVPLLTVVSEKFLLFDPARLVAVIARVLAAAALGVPVSNPEEDRLAQLGRPVPVQVIGAVPLATNWKEYPVPVVPPGNGLLDVMVGATGGGGATRSRHASALSIPGAPNASP